MKINAIFALALVGLLVACAPMVDTAPVASSAPAPAVAEHPEVDTSFGCVDCHADTHPEVVKAWNAGPHGLNNVLCFMCHGSIGEDFTMRPASGRCISCHGEQVATMSKPMMQGKDCFTCHAPHALNPHAVAHGGE
ncbi:MAG: multiheme c-type cytochrome [Thermoanaerobaculia bacterium]